MDTFFHWLDEFVRVFSAHLATVILFAVLVWGRNYALKVFCKVFRWLQRLITGKRFILIWTDVGYEICVGLANKVQERMPDYAVKPLASVKDLGKYPLRPWTTGAVALIVAEVTKFSEDKKERKRFQKRIKKYVGNGGGLFGGHDIIYLRTRNEILQQIFGCQTNSYHRADKAVRYQVNDSNKNHAICRELPDEFLLTDDEVTIGEWGDVANVLYSTGGRRKHPLVAARAFGRGKVVWSNSGDSGIFPPKSISEPEEAYVALLSASLEWLSTPRNQDARPTDVVADERRVEQT